MHGNKIVKSFEDQPNSIILGNKISAVILNKVNKFADLHKNVVIQYADTLRN